jgi:beta-galactosidase
MKNALNILTLPFAILLLFSCSVDSNHISEAQLFNNNWKFHLVYDGAVDGYEAPAFNDQDWENVAIPHTPRFEPLVVNDQWQGICWYRKHFQIPASDKDKKVFVRFEGAMNKSEVWLNGTKIGEYQGGYLPFTIDLTKHIIHSAENVLAVRLDNWDNPITGPKPMEILDFNMYGGIYRNVWLEVKNPVYITDPIFANKVAGGGIFVTYPEVSKEQAVIRIKTHVKNENTKAGEFSIIHRILDGGQEILSKTSAPFALEASGYQESVMDLVLNDPKLWSPKYPNLYFLETKVISGSKVLDQKKTRIGIRRMEFRGQDFYLNGEKLFLRGVNRHQEYPFIGYALSDNAQYRDALKIKNAGFDYVRLSHYPHSESFMDACDELGLIVIDAILGWQYYLDDVEFQQHVIQTSRDLIRRDRNHPCVLAWEVSLNESWQPQPFIDELVKVAHEEYPGDQCFAAGWQEYGYDIYLQARQHRLSHFNEALEKPYVVSEYGDWEYFAMNAGLNQDAWQNMLPEERSSRQLRGSGEKRLLQQALNIQEAHNDNFNTPAFADGYWVMYDYNRGYADDLEASGIMDIFRIPKYSYYFFRSQRDADELSDMYDPGPMVFIASEWTENSDTEVRVFSNCEEVELKLNDDIIARQKPDQNNISGNLAHPPFTFRLKDFETGALEAIGYISGKEEVRHRVQTPGNAVKLYMEYDESYRLPQAGCKDVFFVYIQQKDNSGTTVPVSSGVVQLVIEGNAQLINPEPLTFEAGIATALIMAGEIAGPVRLKAISEGLEDGNMVIEIQK